MASITWPNTLPQIWNVEGYVESPPDNLIRQSMDIGPDKVRRRQTSAVRKIECSHIMSVTQLGYLETFYVTTSYYGALAMDLPHPRLGTGSTVEARFAAPPVYTPLGGISWRVSYSFEILP